MILESCGKSTSPEKDPGFSVLYPVFKATICTGIVLIQLSYFSFQLSCSFLYYFIYLVFKNKFC